MRRTTIKPVTVYGKTYRTIGGLAKRIKTEQERIDNVKIFLSGDEPTKMQREHLEYWLPVEEKRLRQAKIKFEKVKIVARSKNHINTLDDFKGFM